MTRKTEFWWASIHGADPEPVEKTKHEGRACVYTLGCADPFYLDEPGVLLIGDDPQHRPLHPDKEAAWMAADQRGKKSYVYQGKRINFTPRHGWRGPR